MQELQKLKAAFRERALYPDDMFLLSASDALDYVSAGVRSGLPLLGVEGFRITRQGAIQPTQDFSNDIVDCPVPAAFVEETQALIRRGSIESIWFEVVFEEPIQPVQHNAGNRPSSGDFPAPKSPSSLGPRG